MRTTPSSDNLLLGKGEVLFNRRNTDGTYKGFRHMGNVEGVELTTTDDVLEKYSSMDAAAGLYKRVTRKRDAVLRLLVDEFVAENIALMMMGEQVQTAAQAATPVVAEELTDDVQLGGYYKTAKLGPITGVVVDMGATELVLGTDYTIHNPEIGIIHILPTSVTVTPGETITIDYTPTAYADGLTQVRGGTQTLIEGAIMFLPDPTVGPKIMLEIWNASATPDGALGLISSEFAQIAINMAIQADRVNHPLEPMYRATYLE